MSKLNESMESLPKRSLKTKSIINETLPDAMISVNDDEAERQEVEDKRRQQEIEESASKVSKPRKSFFQLVAEYQKLSPSERTAHYQKCLQMSTENKINTQNAFSLLLIDQMAHMMTEKSQMDNFQVAGCTLDASSKIYACRVDVVHTEALRIARGFEKKSKKRLELDEKENDSDGGGNGDEDASPVKGKKIRKRNVLTEKNSLALIAEPDGDGHSVHQKDTIFEEMTTSAEASEPGNCHFLTSLKVQDNLCKLMLQSELPFSRTTQDFTTYCLPDAIQSACENFPNLTGFFICPTLRSDSQEDTPLVEQKTLEEGLQALTSLEENEEVFEMNYDEPEPFEDEENNENVNISDNCEKVSGLDMADNVFDNETMDTVGPPNACRKVVNPETIVDVANIVSLTALEYSFFNQKNINLLGGPERWKIGSFSSTQTGKNPTRRKRKEIVVVEYKQDESVTCSSNTTLTNRTMQMWSPEKLLMDRAVHHEVTDFFKLWALPRAKLGQPRLQRKENDMEVDKESNESGDNCNFAMEFGNDASFTEDCNGNGGQDEFVNQQNTRTEDAFDSVMTYKKDVVVNESMKPPASKAVTGFLPYALKAKKIDMKQLKTAIFDILADSHQNKENTKENQQYFKFSQLYERLPSKLEQKMEENLTPHLAIMALLHLANEKNLLIQDQEDLSDYRITFENS